MTNQEINFFRIRDFILFAQKENMENAKKNNEQWKPCNWKLDRLNFGTAVSTIFNDHTFEEALDAVLLIKAEKPENATEKLTGLRAVVMSEGDFGGSSYLFTSGIPLTEKEYEQVIKFSEEKLCSDINEDGKRRVSLKIDKRNETFMRLATKNGYTKDTGWTEKESVLHFEDLNEDGVYIGNNAKPHAHQLPEGYKLIDNTKNQITSEMKTLLHYYAFQVYASVKVPITQEVFEKRSLAFASLTKQPDYIPALDLMVLDPNNKPCSMIGFWFDSVNKIGIVEPAGTLPEYQRKGLARYIMEEGSQRLRKLGAKELWVGNDLQFYLSCGFNFIHEWYQFEKRI